MAIAQWVKQMVDTLTVYIVDDDESVRDSIRTILEGNGFHCRTYASAEEFLTVLQDAPGCALVDVRMPGMDGLALLEVMKERHIDVPVVMMTGFADVPLAVRAMKAGAIDFIEKPMAREDLLGAVSRAMERTRTAQFAISDQQVAQSRFDRLTDREREVLDLLVSGNPNKTVAHKLGISPRTVEIHRSRLMEKAGVKNFAELVRMALAAGMGTA